MMSDIIHDEASREITKKREWERKKQNVLLDGATTRREFSERVKRIRALRAFRMLIRFRHRETAVAASAKRAPPASASPYGQAVGRAIGVKERGEGVAFCVNAINNR